MKKMESTVEKWCNQDLTSQVLAAYLLITIKYIHSLYVYM